MSEQKALSYKSIESLKPGDKPLVDVGENRGLRVICGKGGTKTFIYRYKSPISGKLAQIKLGNVPELSLAEARLKLQEYKSIRRQGRCPAAELKGEKQEAKSMLSTKNFTVQDLIELYLTQYIEDRVVNGKKIPGARKKKGQDEVRRMLYGDVVRVLAKTPAVDVKRKDVVNLVMEIVDRGANVQAGNILRELSSAYEFAIGLEKFDDEFANPAFLAKASLRQAKVKLTSQRGRRVLSEQELFKFLEWLPGCVFTPTQKNILRFTLWTGCRTGEIVKAEWKDIELDGGTWHLKETKTNVERYVQLPTQAIEFLKQLKMVTGKYPFPSQKTGKPIKQKTITEQAWHLRKTNRMVDIDHWTPHDLRRTVRTGLSRLGCPNEVAEAILGHARSGIEGTYNLHSYEKECKEWLQKWADYMDELIFKSPSKN